MNWKIRHEGSPQSVDGLTASEVVEGLQDGVWEPTDEVMGPGDRQWVAIENHPQFEEIAADMEPPLTPVHEDEARLEPGQAEALEEIDESPGASRGRDRLVDHVKQMIGTLPCGDCVFVDVIAAIDDHVVEELAHQIEHGRDRLDMF